MAANFSTLPLPGVLVGEYSTWYVYVSCDSWPMFEERCLAVSTAGLLAGAKAEGCAFVLRPG